MGERDVAEVGLSLESAGGRVLDLLHAQLPLGVWALTRHDGDHQHVLDARPREQHLVTPGTTVAWRESLCRQLLEGAPAVAARTAEVPAYARAGLTRAWGLRSYLGAPVRGADGRVFGTIAGYGTRELEAQEAARAQPVVALLADLLGQFLHAQHLHEQALVREAELRRLATRDHLTGLATRSVLYDRLAHALELHRADARAVSVLLLDVDDLKTINDTHGHAAGDQALTALTATWTAHINPGTTLARLGGDEFALLVEDGQSPEDLAASVRVDLVQTHEVAGTDRQLAASAGLAHLPADAPTPTPSELLARADAALYAAKRSGGARLVVHEHPGHDRPGPDRPSAEHPTRPAERPPHQRSGRDDR